MFFTLHNSLIFLCRSCVYVTSTIHSPTRISAFQLSLLCSVLRTSRHYRHELRAQERNSQELVNHLSQRLPLDDLLNVVRVLDFRRSITQRECWPCVDVKQVPPNHTTLRKRGWGLLHARTGCARVRNVSHQTAMTACAEGRRHPSSQSSAMNVCRGSFASSHPNGYINNACICGTVQTPHRTLRHATDKDSSFRALDWLRPAALMERPTGSRCAAINVDTWRFFSTVMIIHQFGLRF